MTPQPKNFNAADLLEYAQAERLKERELVVRLLKEKALDEDSLTIHNFVREVVFALRDLPA